MAMNIRDRKLVQILAYLANKSNRSQINKLKAIKLAWAADRYHVRKYGRLVTGDDYFALKYGPVASQLKNIAEEDSYLPESYIEYSKNFIKPSKDRNTVEAQADADLDLLSTTDREALDFAIDSFGQYSGFELADYSHKYPEWKRFEKVLDSGEVARARIDLDDFFKSPSDIENDPFSIDEEILNNSHRVFVENREVEQALTI